MTKDSQLSEAESR